MAATSRTAGISYRLGMIGAFTFLVGPLLAQVELLSAFISFRLLLLGLLLCLIALVFGVFGLIATRASTGREGRAQAWIGMGLGILVLAIVAVPMVKAGPAPMINDITTNPEDPPRFFAAQTDDANSGRDLSYPGESFASQQRAAYPDIEPIHLDLPRQQAFSRCVMAARKLGWAPTTEDAASGTFEATDKSSLFGFVDDISVRVRESGGGAVVDIRSKSRDGKGDMGANAARIRAFRDWIEE